jgi:polyisoprenyl-teichoic acid--peptidoglycan teichoic acid transferase
VRARVTIPDALSTVTTPPAMLSPSGGAPLGSVPPEPPRRGWWSAKRFLLAAVGIVLLSGGATYAIARNEVGKLVEAFHQNKPVKVAPHVLASTSRGAPETLLLVGNDERALTQYYHHAVLPHSNEMLLVRIDPSKPTISMLSIPRELQVPITKPDGEVESNRINSAYTFGWENGGGTAGGVKLMVQTIKQVLGITVNHVFITNFHKFERAVDDMGCVYMTVDKRYYHNNAELEAEQYMEINLQPGYQRVCGKQAREFVSNRHESTSLIRDARDQRFLLATKAQYGGSLFENRDKFERIFGKYVESTLESEEEILQLLYLLVGAAGKPVRQVDFHVNLERTIDTATPQQIQEAVHSLYAGTTRLPKQKLNIAKTRTAHAHHAAAPSPSLRLSPTPSSTLDAARSIAPSVPFPVEAPFYQQTTAESLPDEVHRYDIRGSGGRLYPAYVVVVQQGELGQYYDVQGSTWTSSPLLDRPNNTVTIGSRTYSLFYDGEHLQTVAWFEDNAAYWIENTLTNSLSSEQMVAIARETRPVIGHVAARASEGVPPPLSTGRLNLPPRTVATTGLAIKIGALLGFLGLGVVAALSLLVFARQRELHALREQIANALVLEARQRRLLATAGGIPRPAPAPTVYHARRGWRRGVLATGAVASVGVLAALAVHFFPAIFG